MLAGRPKTRATTGSESPEPPWPTSPLKLRVPWGLEREIVATFRPCESAVIAAPEPTTAAASKIRVSHSVEGPPVIRVMAGSGRACTSVRPRPLKFG